MISKKKKVPISVERKKSNIIGYSRVKAPAPAIGLQNISTETYIREETPNEIILEKIVFVKDCPFVNIRSEPTKQSSSFLVVPNGTKFAFLSRQNGWTKVQGIENRDLIGFIMDQYIGGL